MFKVTPSAREGLLKMNQTETALLPWKDCHDQKALESTLGTNSDDLVCRVSLFSPRNCIMNGQGEKVDRVQLL